jgi:hypothetical protein
MTHLPEPSVPTATGTKAQLCFFKENIKLFEEASLLLNEAERAR